MDYLPVPRDAFEQFQAALRRESKKLIADCAEFLRVSPQELQKEVALFKLLFSKQMNIRVA